MVAGDAELLELTITELAVARSKAANRPPRRMPTAIVGARIERS
jgi:hypothetical protein